MSDNTSIEWTTTTWNPTTGCDKVSPGCGLPRPGSDDEQTGRTGGCYAMTMARRLKAMGQEKYQNDGDPRTSGPGFGVTMHPDALTDPLGWTKPRKVFVNSMSDLFHEQVSDEFIAKVFAVMIAAPQHTFQVLTKRHGRMRFLLNSEAHAERVAAELAALWRVDRVAPLRGPVENIWLGVSAEDQKWADIRIPALVKTPAAIRFVSAEPLLGPITLHHGHTHCPTHDFSGGFCTGTCPDRITPDWVISGGESGPGARPAHPDWFRQLRDDCTTAGIAYFHKQHGAYTPVRDRPQPGDLWVYPDGTSTKWGPEDGHVRRYDREFRADTFDGESVLVRRVGKKNAGRELDGRTWDEFPTTRTAVA